MGVRVQVETFDAGAELNALHSANLGIGAVVSFVGYVRDFNDGQPVAGMLLEHYPGMTEKALAVADGGDHPPGRVAGAGRAHCLCRHQQRPSSGRVRRLRLHHGLPQDPCALLEEGAHA